MKEQLGKFLDVLVTSIGRGIGFSVGAWIVIRALVALAGIGALP